MARDMFYDVAWGVVSGQVRAITTARATVYDGGTTNVSTIFVAESGATPQTNPWTPSNGIVVFWANSGNYDVKIEDTAVPAAFATRTVRFSSISGGTNGIATSQLPATVPAGNLPTPFTASQLDATTVTNNLWSPGDIKASAASSPQTGWLLCNGQAVSRSTFSTLFSITGTTWGSGDGSTTFNVPDLRGRGLIGVGTGSGLTARTLGQTGGEENHTLSTSEMPSHNHTLTDPGHVHNWSTYLAAFAGGGISSEAWFVTGGSLSGQVRGNSSTTGITLANAGSGSSHNNMQPWVAVNYFIKT